MNGYVAVTEKLCVCEQDVGMGDKAMTSFLGCCVQLLQILMEVTELLVKNQSSLSFFPFYVPVSKMSAEQSMESGQCLALKETSSEFPL